MKKRILALALSIAMVLSFLPFSVFAAETTATITFDNKSEMTSPSTSVTTQQVWEENGIVVTYNKKSYNNDLVQNVNPIRFYKGTEVIIAYPEMTKIVVEANTTAYATTLSKSTFTNSPTVTVSSKNVTITFAEPVDSVTITMSSGQVRVNKMTITAGAPDADACKHENFTLEGYVAPELCKAGYSGDKVCDDCGETFETGSTINPLEYEADSEITIAQAIELGKAFPHNEYTTGKFYVVGEITEVYNTQYGNMYIQDAEGNKLTVYGTYSADGKTSYQNLATKPAAGDTVKLYGIIGCYSNAAQMKNGWIIEIVDGETPEAPKEPEDGSVLTIPEAIELATQVGSSYSTGKFYIDGVVTKITNTTFGNLYIEDAEGNELYVYGIYDATGETRYDAMENAPKVGDSVTLYGSVGTYSGTPQMKNAWLDEVITCAHANTTLTGVIEAKCGVAGYTGDKVCDTCGRVAEQGTPTEPLAHDEDVKLEGYAAECGKAGLTDGTKCSKCGDVQKEQVAIEALEHKMVAGDVVEPTETAAGYTVYTCENGCGKTEKKDYVMPTSSEVKNVKAEQITETMDLRVTWDAIEGADMYLVYVYDAEGTQVRGATVTNGNNAVRIDGFKVGTYTVKVRARVGGKYTANYEGVDVAFGSILPESPVVTVVETDKESITVTWAAVEGAQKYFVEFVGGDQRFAPSATDTTLTISGLKVGTEYKISVCVKLSDTVYTPYGEQVTAKTDAHAEIDITATKTQDGIVVAWDVTNDGDSADKYWVKRVDAEGNVTQIAVTTAESIVAKDVEGANTFYIIARVYDRHGIARYVTSEVATAITLL